MNAAILLMTCVAGADGAPPAIAAPAPAPAAVSAAPIGWVGGGCGGCGTAGCAGASDPCPPDCSKPNLFAKLRSKFGTHGCNSCGTPAPSGCSSCGSAPVYTGFTTAAGDCCGSSGGLFSRLRSRFNHGSYHTDCGGCGTSWAAPSGCALPPAPGAAVPAPPVGQPQQMKPPEGGAAPKPMATPPAGTTPKTTYLTVPPVVTPVSGPKAAPPLGGTGSPF